MGLLVPEIRFDPVKHHYWLGDKRLPSVNEILTKIGVKKEYTGDPYYGEIGTMAAKAIELHLKGTLDEESVDEAIRPRLEAFKKFQKDTKYESLECERIHHDGEYAGTPDHLGVIGETVVLLDTKCTEQLKHYETDCQLSGYWHLYNLPPKRKGALRLGKDGAYEVKWYDEVSADDLWRACWTLYRRKMLK